VRKGVAEVGEFLQDDGPNADNEPSALSDWLRDQEVVALARFARDARLVGVSFGRRLRQHGKPTGTLDEAITLG